MEGQQSFPALSAKLQVNFFYLLKDCKLLYFREALQKTIKEIDISTVDKELGLFVGNSHLSKMAGFSLRGETVFPVPSVLSANPFLLGYYRLLLGFSQKEFYSKGPFGRFKTMEEKGKLTSIAKANMEGLCESLIISAKQFIDGIDVINLNDLSELQLLTLGPQFRGSKNNEYGSIATKKVFDLIRDFTNENVESESPTIIVLKNDSNRKVIVSFSSDPDIEIFEELPSGKRPLVSIEIKGGTDISNIHNRIGEAEKSHQKAKGRKYFEFITILSVDIDYEILRKESPTTSHFFQLNRISNFNSVEYLGFRELLSSIIGLTIV
jgi:hypothetical protein